VKDSKGQKLAYVYYEEEPGRRSSAKLLSKDEARWIAANVARLPDCCERAARHVANRQRQQSRQRQGLSRWPSGFAFVPQSAAAGRGIGWLLELSGQESPNQQIIAH
jgi:hypothetical protein